MFDGGAVPHDNPAVGVWALTLPLGVDAGHVQRFPDLLQQVVHVQVELATAGENFHFEPGGGNKARKRGKPDDHRVWQAGKAVNLLDGDLVDLVVNLASKNTVSILNFNCLGSRKK